VLRFRLYQTVSVSDFLGAFQVFAFAFPFPATPTLSEVFGRADRLFIPEIHRDVVLKNPSPRATSRFSPPPPNLSGSRQLL
ncbi:hypothetical protein PV735_12755, partial [Streptomyces turgidiscabies]|uniref:hypothetical protein n=2 Tax=Streptomyces turgidiscabies TaxID=85558 RepID=UPI0029B98472